MIVTKLRKCSDLIREGKVFVENKTKVASRVGCSERAVLYFTELLFKSNIICICCLSPVLFALKYLTTELAHSKLKYGLFSRVISCYDRSAQN